jgi:hypothetical protein
MCATNNEMYRILMYAEINTLLGNDHISAQELTTRRDAASQFVFDCRTCSCVCCSTIPTCRDTAVFRILQQNFKSVSIPPVCGGPSDF